MTPDATAEPRLRQDLHSAVRTGPADARSPQMDVVGALLEALNSPEAYRLVDRGGELFIEPVREMRRH